MGKKYEKITGRFSAKDSYGKVYDILEITEYEDIGEIGTEEMESVELRARQRGT